ncbi:MAG: PPOX class F420-dependent oxidoreductase [Streptomycetales bacterium]
MDVTDAQRFIRANHRAVLTTLRGDGLPQLSPVLCTVDDTGRVVVSTRETAMKTRNLRRDPRVAVCVVNDGFFGQWIQVEGEAEIVPLPEAMDGLIAYYRSISGEHPNWDEYREAMHAEGRVLVRFPIARAGPDVHG